jgi:hypothetical protein
VLSSVIGTEEEPSALCVTSVVIILDVIGVTNVDVASVVMTVVLVTGETDVELFVGACLFANSIKLLATSGACL